MWPIESHLLDACFEGPVWPASTLLLFVVAYLLVSLIGLINFDGPELELDADGWQSIGATTLRWFNLGAVPIIVWLGLFAIFQWLIAYGLWHFYESKHGDLTYWKFGFLVLRNATFAAFLTKLATTPLVPYLKPADNFRAGNLIGELCRISSIEATAKYGQAKYATGGAPLLLNVRTTGETLLKGQTAIITHYDESTRLYTVQSDSTSSDSTTQSD